MPIDVEALRRKAGFRTRRKAADFFGVAENTVYRWESGRTEFPEYAQRLLEMQARIAELERTVKSSNVMATAGVDQLIRRAFKDARKRRSLSQAELGQRAHVSRGTVSHFESQGVATEADALGSMITALVLEPARIMTTVPIIGESLAAMPEPAFRALVALLIDEHLVNERSSGELPRRGKSLGQTRGQRPLFRI